MSAPALNLVVLRSSNMERAVAFYRELGLVFTKHAHGKGPDHYASEVGGFVFELYPLTQAQTPTTSTRVGFRVSSVDELLPKLRSLGTEVVSPPQDSPWGRRAVVKDLDGHSVELVSSPTSEAESTPAE
jgi:catechol 2,3-dioxygenase-like lactoylglutathione lyase family enzyme